MWGCSITTLLKYDFTQDPYLGLVKSYWAHIACVRAVRSKRQQNRHFHNGDMALALFLGFKPKNEAIVVCVLLLYKIIIIQSLAAL